MLEVAFWRSTDADTLNKYISVRSIFLNIFCEIVICFYLYDQGVLLFAFRNETTSHYHGTEVHRRPKRIANVFSIFPQMTIWVS